MACADSMSANTCVGEGCCSIHAAAVLMQQVLGGQVEELVEAWTFQRKFGNVQRSKANSEDTEQPPPFQNFVPGRRHNQAGHR